MSEKLNKLKNFLKSKDINYYALQNSDEFFNEYLPESEKRIELLTNFTGSNAFVIFGIDKSYFFTDGRYILQSNNQLDLDEFEIIDMAEILPLNWLKNNVKNGEKVALDSKLFSIDFVEKLQDLQNKNIEIKLFRDAISLVWEDRPSESKTDVFLLKENQVGKKFSEKKQEIIRNLTSDALLISKPENICWLLNLRASDIEFSPFLLTYAILYKDGKIDLFCDENRFKNISKNEFETGDLKDVNLVNFEKISETLQKISSIEIVKKSTNFKIFEILKAANLEINFPNSDIIENLKAVKNEVEIKGAIKAHEIDGKALTKFINWLDLELKNGQEITEISAQEKLLEFRKEDENFLYPSFGSISGFGENGAIIHYQASEKTNKKFTNGSLYLIDSGGQYLGKDFCGTTDVTRTIAIGNPSQEMIEDFTRVLKGHIAIARAKFPKGTSGADLDVLARFHLWNAGKNYAHGTGHGVGAFLSVHEGPCGISPNSKTPLKPGMILSNEPGFYKEGEYGIRIENLVLVEEFDENFLCFKTLTLAPIDEKLIDFKMLTYPEKKWLENYNSKINF